MREDDEGWGGGEGREGRGEDEEEKGWGREILGGERRGEGGEG